MTQDPRNINQIINHSQIDSDNKQIRQCKNSKQWNSETEKLVLGLFARFGDLFQNKCKAQGLEIYDNDNNYTSTFKLWCLKLFQARITIQDAARGIKHLEEYIRDSVRSEREIWPCSYAEFIGHCQDQEKREKHKLWQGLPKPVMSIEDKKKAMQKLREDLKL